MTKLFFTALVFLILDLSGCNLFKPSFSRKRINDIIPVKESSAFLAIVEEDTYDVNHKYKEVRYLIRIDSIGNVRTLAELDSGLYHTLIINDSIVINQSYSDSAIYAYNVNSSQNKLLMKGYKVRGISNNRCFIAIENYTTDTSYIYHLETDQALAFKRVGATNGLLMPFGEDQFLRGSPGMRSDEMFVEIFNLNTQPTDTIPYATYYFDFGTIKPESQKGNVVLVTTPMALNRFKNMIVRYHLRTRRVDTLFKGLYYSDVLPLSDSNYYLILGMTAQEYSELMEAQYQDWKQARDEGIYIDHAPPTGYWMVGDSKTNRVWKKDLTDFRPVVSTNGQYLLFYDNRSTDYQFRVISLKNLIIRSN